VLQDLLPGDRSIAYKESGIDLVTDADRRAAGRVRLLGMSRADFNALFQRQPEFGYTIIQVLSGRLKTSHLRAIQDLQEKNRQLTAAYENLRAAQEQIVEKEKLERELQVAYQIQMGILPRRLPDPRGYDFGARIVPMRSVGGDFYDFIPLGEGATGIAIGDVSGHGVPAALFMAITVTLLRAAACEGCSPRQVLERVNRQLRGLSDPPMFVTMLWGVFDAGTGDFTYARAGHEPPMLLGQNGQWVEPVLGSGAMLGFFDNPALDEQSVRLAQGDALFMYTDGATEARDEQGAMIGEGRLREMVTLHLHEPAQVLCERVLESVMSHGGAAALQDDITLVCVKAGSAPSHKLRRTSAIRPRGSAWKES